MLVSDGKTFIHQVFKMKFEKESSNVLKIALAALKEIAAIDESHYPGKILTPLLKNKNLKIETLRKLYMINCPRIFTVFYKVFFIIENKKIEKKNFPRWSHPG